VSNFQTFQHFKESVEIDYFTYFSKCYFALNAYMKSKFQGNDREKIDKLNLVFYGEKSKGGEKGFALKEPLL